MIVVVMAGFGFGFGFGFGGGFLVFGGVVVVAGCSDSLEFEW